MSGPRSTRSRPGGWRDYVTLLHLPYTLWHLSYVAVGAALAPHFQLDRMLWTLAAFALALGVAAHALDELNGRPLSTQIGSGTLVALSVVSLAGALRDRRLRRGRLGLRPARLRRGRRVPRPGVQPRVVRRPLPHRLVVRARVGRLPRADRLLRRGAVDPASRRVLAAAYATALSLSQRRLSTPVRQARRDARRHRRDASRWSARSHALTWASVLLACALVTARLT